MSRAGAAYPANRLILREVGLRDGLQMTRVFPDTDAKLNWIAGETAAGIRHYEIGSFLPAKRFPQFADVAEVAARSGALPGVHQIGLALNERGVDDALAAGLDEIGLVVSATEEHSEANQRRSIAEAIALVERAVRLAGTDGPLIGAGISMAFGCSITGSVAPEGVLDLVRRLSDAGADVIALADTVGHAGPDQVGQLTRDAIGILGKTPLAIHLHDTRGLGLSNAAAAIDAGCRVLDASLGGLGGCPFAPGATGNIVMEDLVFLSQTKGLRHDIDLEALLALRGDLPDWLPGEALHGAMVRAGPPMQTIAAR